MIYYILLLVSVNYLSTDIYLPSLPAITKFFGVDPSIIKLTITFFVLCLSFSPLIFGPLSDHFGRRKIIFFGIFIGIIASLCCAFAPNIYWLFLGRILQGISVGAVIVCGRAMVADLFSGKELAKNITTITMLIPFITVLAPLIGGYLQEYFQWRLIFIVLLSYYLLLLIITIKLPETVNVKKPLSFRKNYKALLTNKAFMCYGLCTIFPVSCNFAYITITAFLFQNAYGLSPSAYGKLALYISAVTVIFGYITNKLLNYLDLNKMILFGVSFIMLSGISLISLRIFYLNTAIFTFSAILFFFCSHAYLVTNATVKGLSYLSGNYGAARGLLSTGQFLAGTVGSLIFAKLPINDGFYLGVFFIINALLILLFLAMGYNASKVEIKEFALIN